MKNNQEDIFKILKSSNGPLSYQNLRKGKVNVIKKAKVSCPYYGVTQYKVGHFYKIISNLDV